MVAYDPLMISADAPETARKLPFRLSLRTANIFVVVETIIIKKINEQFFTVIVSISTVSYL